MASLKSLRTLSCSHFAATMAVSLAVYEIFSIKEWRDLKNWVKGCSSSLQMAPFERPYTTFCWSAIVKHSIVYLVPLSSYLPSNNIVGLRSLNVRSSKVVPFESLVRFPIRLP